MPFKPPPWKPPPWTILHYRHLPILLTIAILLVKTNTNKTISTLDVYPRRIFLSNKHFYNIHFATTPLPSTSITLKPLIITSTSGNTLSYPSKFAVTNLTLLTNDMTIITFHSTTPTIDSRDDIVHPSTSPTITLLPLISTRGNPLSYPFNFSVTTFLSLTSKTNITTPISTPPAINNRGDTIHSSTQLAFTTTSISYSIITSYNTLSSTVTIWNNIFNNKTEITQLFNNINTNPTDNIWHTYSDIYYPNEHSRITTNINIATYQISSCHAASLLSPTITDLQPLFRLPNFSHFPTIFTFRTTFGFRNDFSPQNLYNVPSDQTFLTFRNAFSPQNFYNVPSRQTSLTFRNAFFPQKFYSVPSRQSFFYQTFHTITPQNFLINSLLLLPLLRNSFSPPNFSNFQPSDDNNTKHNSFTSSLYSELLYHTMPNYPPPRLSNITTTSRRSSTHVSQGDASTINSPTSSPTTINHTTYRSSNRVDSPTYRSIVNNTTTFISPFTSNTTTDLRDTPCPTQQTLLYYNFPLRPLLHLLTTTTTKLPKMTTTTPPFFPQANPLRFQRLTPTTITVYYSMMTMTRTSTMMPMTMNVLSPNSTQLFLLLIISTIPLNVQSTTIFSPPSLINILTT